ncbi:MAG TPA: DUF3618 domain-containing protein [Vitreimonas sp.]|uniref:DUF3618 domain-containing protein n=1 Tax=Vitreimonas sp. TaxID=3069702 RepID=UPI002D27270A|nr:DUF3618 domain-containing protein [Vitreimonas sp.]HYD86869.1 DUF3618 domain-containing protein [Vitreimonas sp.]
MSVETDRIEADLNQSRSQLSETLDALGNKLSPNHIASEVAGMAKTKAKKIASGVTHGVTRQARDNPLPLLLIGAGVAWLVVNNRNKAHESQISAEDWSSERRYRSLEEARWATPRLPNETDEAYDERVHQAYASALGMKQKAGEALSEFRTRVSHAVEGAKHAAAGARDRIGRTLSGVAHRATGGARYVGAKATSGASYLSHRASEGASFVSHKAADGYHYVGAKATEARDASTRFYQENPLAVGAILLGAGALIGMLAPLSRTERESLRGVADTVGRSSAEFAERGVRMVEERVQGAKTGATPPGEALH